VALDIGPGSPGAGRANLDSPPPPPPSLRTPDMTGLAENSQANPQVPPGAQLIALVAQQAQLAEQTIMSLARMLPTFVPVAAQIQSAIRSAVTQALQQVQGQGQEPGGPPVMG